MRAWLAGKKLSGCALSIVTTAPPAGAIRIGGWAVSAGGSMCCSTAAPAATALRRDGIAFSDQGAMHITDSDFTASSILIGGFAISSLGALHCNSAAASKIPTFAGVDVTNSRLSYVIGT